MIYNSLATKQNFSGAIAECEVHAYRIRLRRRRRTIIINYCVDSGRR